MEGNGYSSAISGLVFAIIGTAVSSFGIYTVSRGASSTDMRFGIAWIGLGASFLVMTASEIFYKCLTNAERRRFYVAMMVCPAVFALSCIILGYFDTLRLCGYAIVKRVNGHSFHSLQDLHETDKYCGALLANLLAESAVYLSILCMLLMPTYALYSNLKVSKNPTKEMNIT